MLRLHRPLQNSTPQGDISNVLDETPKKRRRAREQHAFAIRHGISGQRAAVALACTYARAGGLADARKILDRMAERDVASWTAVLAACIDYPAAIALLAGMLHDEVAPDTRALAAVLRFAAADQGRQLHALAAKRRHDVDRFVGCSLVDMYGRGGALGEARAAFARIEDKDAACYGSLMCSYGRRGATWEVVSIFAEMVVAGVEPSQSSFVALLNSCATAGHVCLSEQCHAQAIVWGFGTDEAVQGVTVDMYAKCGDLAGARRAFDRIDCARNVIAWNSIIGGYAKHGKASEALETFRLMSAITTVTPDHITFTHLLSACSHAGLVSEGCTLFHLMQDNYGIAARNEHFCSVIDLLARSGMVTAAYDFILASDCEHRPSVWSALLSASRSHKNSSIAAVAAERLLELEPGCSGGYVALAGVHAAGNRWHEMALVRALMDDRSVTKDAGLSTINIRSGELRAFGAGKPPSDSKRRPSAVQTLCVLLNASISTDWGKIHHDLQKEGFFAVEV